VTAAKKSNINEEKQSVVYILNSLSEEKSLELFKVIAGASAVVDDRALSNDTSIDTQLLISKVKLTRKQYYSRISTLISSGLVKRSNGKYLLTSLGKIIYGVYVLIDQAIQNHWKLKAIDALESKSSSGILDEEKKKVVDMLIDNKDLKAMLGTRQISSKPLKSAPKDVTLSALMQVNST
jgi:hypothetical protein